MQPLARQFIFKIKDLFVYTPAQGWGYPKPETKTRTNHLISGPFNCQKQKQSRSSNGPGFGFRYSDVDGRVNI
jgi:hypothetical protein